jgi:hypothetical protein
MQKQEKTIGRNDPCPCGSGLKYKNCHYGMEVERFQESPTAATNIGSSFGSSSSSSSSGSISRDRVEIAMGLRSSGLPRG